MSARDHWTTDQLWRDWHLWRDLVARKSWLTPHNRNTFNLRAASSFSSLTKRRPGLRDPDRSAQDSIEGRTAIVRVDHAQPGSDRTGFYTLDGRSRSDRAANWYAMKDWFKTNHLTTPEFGTSRRQF